MVWLKDWNKDFKIFIVFGEFVVELNMNVKYFI